MKMFKSGSYRFIDNSNNLIFRLRIKKSTTHKVFENDSFDESDISSQTFEEHFIKWQQKIFSQNEIEWYKLDRDYKTFLEKKYHIEINKLERKPDKKPIFEIFTITNNDIPLERWKQFLDKNVLGFNFKERLMFLMLETEDEPNGVILCKVCMQTTGKLLKVTPDFNSLSQAYTLKHININSQGSCDVDYVVDIEPNKLKREEIENRKFLIEKLRFGLTTGRPKLSSVQMGILMEPLMNSTLIQMNGEISFAENFDAWNLCVCFYIEANQNWKFVNNLNDSFFYGTTQKCFLNNNDFAFFSTPFETQLKYENQNIFMDKWPLLYLKVLSFDYWNRTIAESYGFVELPKKIGRYPLTIKTWKLYSNNPLNKMRHFFLGSLPQLENIAHKNLCSSNTSKNNYGLHYESSGSVYLNFDVLMQTESPQISKQSNGKMKSLSFSTMQQNILSVVSAFQRAKKRMDYIRNEINKSNKVINF